MMTLLESLSGTNAYPVPLPALRSIAVRRGLDLDQMATKEQLDSPEYMRAKADLLMWLSGAPDISQGGQSYSFTDEQRDRFRKQAGQLYKEAESVEEGDKASPVYGYKGSVL